MPKTSAWLIAGAGLALFGALASHSSAPAPAAQFKQLSEPAKYDFLKTYAEKEGAAADWKLLLATYVLPNGAVTENVHDLAHYVGKLLFEEQGLKGLSVCDATFAFGCYHGLMETAFEADQGTPAKYRADLAQAGKSCQGVGAATSPTYWSCIHGIGHGVATFRDYALAPALKDCDTFDPSITTYCHDGVFMEFSLNAPKDFYKPSDPLYPCDAVAEPYKVACARSQVQVMRFAFKMDTGAIADACLKSGDSAIMYHCVDALGYFVAQASASSAPGIIEGCRAIADAKASAQCLAAAAGELVFQNSAGWQASAAAVCESLSGSYRSDCDARVESVKKSYGRD